MRTTHTTETLTIKITPNDNGNPAGKLADAELHFGGDSPLAGLKLIGFSIWERRGANGRNVTFPARTYVVNGDRRAFALGPSWTQPPRKRFAMACSRPSPSTRRVPLSRTRKPPRRSASALRHYSNRPGTG
jgi:hypothetical protein